MLRANPSSEEVVCSCRRCERRARTKTLPVVAVFGNVRLVASSSPIGAMSVITTGRSGDRTLIVGQLRQSDGLDCAPVGASLMVCQPAHVHAERQVLCDGFHASEFLLEADLRGVRVAAPWDSQRRGPRNIDADPLASPDPEQFRSPRPGSVPVPELSSKPTIRTERPLDATYDAFKHERRVLPGRVHQRATVRSTDPRRVIGRWPSKVPHHGLPAASHAGLMTPECGRTHGRSRRSTAESACRRPPLKGAAAAGVETGNAH